MPLIEDRSRPSSWCALGTASHSGTPCAERYRTRVARPHAGATIALALPVDLYSSAPGGLPRTVGATAAERGVWHQALMPLTT
jgi:hypothetical protein